MSKTLSNYIKERTESAQKITKLIADSLAIYPLKKNKKEIIWEIMG